MVDPAGAEKPTKLLARPFVRRMLVTALLAEIGYAVLNISTMPVYLKNDRNFGSFGISIVLVAFLLSEAVMKGPMGHLADRVGHKRLMMIGPFLTLGTSVASLVLPRLFLSPGGLIEVVMFVLLRLCDGVGAAMLWPAMFALMGDGVEDDQRQQAMSFLNMCYLLAIALAMPIGGIVEDLTGGLLQNRTGAFSGGLFLSAAVFLAVGLTVLRLPIKAKVIEHHGEEEGFNLKAFLETAKSISSYLVLAAVTFCGIGFPMANVKVFALEEFNLSPTGFGTLVFPAAIAMAALSDPMAKLGERIGRARAVHWGLAGCAAGLAFICLGAFIPAFRSPYALAFGGIPVGLGFLMTIPAWLASVSDLDPRKRAANVGAVMTAQGLGAIVGAPIGGWLYQSLGVHSSLGHYLPFIGTAACVTAGWLISLRILRDP